MATIRPADLPAADNVPSGAAIIVDTGATVQKATPEKIVDAAAPLASEADAINGVGNNNRMSALRVKQAMDANLATTAALASTDPGKGAEMVALPQGGKVADTINYITPQMFGALADWNGTLGTDDTTAIQNAYDAAKALGWTLNIPQGAYLISGDLVFDSDITVIADGAVFYDNSNDPGVALTVGAGAGSLIRRPRILGHLVLEKLTADWSVERHGLKIQNCYMGEFHVSVLKYNRGVWLHADLTGCVYNHIYLNQLTNNKYSTYLSNETSLGWCNQNTFWGGRYSNGINDVGCHITIDDSLYASNGNSWQNPSLEASFASFSLFNLLGSQNSIIGGRFEHGGAPAKYGVLGGTKNSILAYSAPYLTIDRVDITGTLYVLETSVGSARQYQGGYALEKQGAGAVLSLRGTTSNGGLEVLTTAGARAVHIPANAAWEVFNGKKVLWRSTTAPASDTWSRGDIAWVTNPSAGGPVGYVCTVAGTPGTWVPFGIAGAQRATTVADPTGGSTVDTECRAQLAAVIDALQAAGLMA